MSSEKPSPTESFVHQMLGTLVAHDVITDDLRHQIIRDAGNSLLAGSSRGFHGAPDLNDAVSRLKAFRATWNPGDAIDERSGLTADDLDAVIAFVNDFPSSD